MRHIEIVDNGYPVGDARRIAGKNLTVVCNSDGSYTMRCFTEDTNEERWLRFSADGTISGSKIPSNHYTPAQNLPDRIGQPGFVNKGEEAQRILGLLVALMFNHCTWYFSALGLRLPQHPAFQCPDLQQVGAAFNTGPASVHTMDAIAITRVESERPLIEKFDSDVMRILKNRHDELVGCGHHDYRTGGYDKSFNTYLMSFYDGVRIAKNYLLGIKKLADIPAVYTKLLHIKIDFLGGGGPGSGNSHNPVIRCEPLFLSTANSADDVSMTDQLSVAVKHTVVKSTINNAFSPDNRQQGSFEFPGGNKITGVEGPLDDVYTATGIDNQDRKKSIQFGTNFIDEIMIPVNAVVDGWTLVFRNCMNDANDKKRFIQFCCQFVASTPGDVQLPPPPPPVTGFFAVQTYSTSNSSALTDERMQKLLVACLDQQSKNTRWTEFLLGISHDAPTEKPNGELLKVMQTEEITITPTSDVVRLDFIEAVRQHHGQRYTTPK